MFDRFTDKSRQVVVTAQQWARELNHPRLGTGHLLYGLCMVDGPVADELSARGLHADAVTTFLIDNPPQGTAPVEGALPFTDDARRMLEMSIREALRTGQHSVTPEHLFTAIFRTPGSSAHQILEARGFDESAAEAFKVPSPVGSNPDAGQDHPSRARRGDSILESFGRDLNQAARDGQIDPVIGRQGEIERVLHVLGRRTKNNPVLVGEPGVGKSAVVEGLAHALVSGQAPDSLAGKTVVSLDLAGLISGTRYRGDFEERIKKLLDELKRRPEVIVFIDEIHALVGAGGGEGALDAANMLKPMLARGEIQVIGATTYDEWRKHIEKDAALARRLQQVTVGEPSVDETRAILHGLRGQYESHHRVTYTDRALAEAARMAKQYLPERNLPDSAIDVIDEAGSRAMMAGIGEIDETMIAEIIASMTGIPVGRVSSDETSRLATLDHALSGSVIGQTEAVSALARAVRRSRAGLSDPRRPNGSFIFAGPTGVGKTMLARTLAKQLFGDEDALIVVDMSEYMEKHAVSRLFGAPPGYLGHDEAGQLTEKVRRRPHSVVLFDEIEKAHPDVFNSLLQVLEEGRLTDGSGRVVDFRNTFIILTSNLGTAQTSGTMLGFDNGDGGNRRQNTVQRALQENFRPEFLNRIDEVIVFRQLDRQDVSSIATQLLLALELRLIEQGISLEVTPDALARLGDLGYDRNLGARPLRRVIQRHIEDPLAELIVARQDRPVSRALVSESNGDIHVSLLDLSGSELPIQSLHGTN